MALTFDDVIISYDLIVFNKAGIKLQGNQSQNLLMPHNDSAVPEKCLNLCDTLTDLFQTENSASF